jgi:hypothetical protein
MGLLQKLPDRNIGDMKSGMVCDLADYVELTDRANAGQNKSHKRRRSQHIRSLERMHPTGMAVGCMREIGAVPAMPAGDPCRSRKNAVMKGS